MTDQKKRVFVETPNKYGRFEYLEEKHGTIYHCSGYTKPNRRECTLSETPLREEDRYSPVKWFGYIKPALDKLRAGKYDDVPDSI